MMSFIKKVAKAVNPLDKETYKNALNPAKKPYDAYKQSGSAAALDPYETFGNNRTLVGAEMDAARAKGRADFEKEKKKRKATRGYKAGGKTTCRGMGKATQGGTFRKDG
jgi:hypothetical protein